MGNIEPPYSSHLSGYRRRKTWEVNIGGVPLGAHHPIRLQSMTTTDTLDTRATVEQSIRMIEAGCEYVRITAPSIHEAKNLENIRKELRARGYHAPLVADIHFTPNAAEIAARIVEKVRINPGNYADKKLFEQKEYTEAEYEAELERIRKRFAPLVAICKEHGTAMRIGTNHGSLSDRIMNRYGDTPLGMVESALEFLRICEDMGYRQVVLSMKASNPIVMVQAYRMLVARLDELGWHYPLHLGVTEAGDGAEGRIKSAMGIGALLEDGLGDTVRVSLTEEPEHEIPVARAIVERCANRKEVQKAPSAPYETTAPQYPLYQWQRRKTREVAAIGGNNVPRVVGHFQEPVTDMEQLADVGYIYDPVSDKWQTTDLGADLLFAPEPFPFMLPNAAQAVFPAGKGKGGMPVMGAQDYLSVPPAQSPVLVEAHAAEVSDALLHKLSDDVNAVLALGSPGDPYGAVAMRSVFNRMLELEYPTPVLLRIHLEDTTDERFLIDASAQAGTLLQDGFGDGLWLSTNNPRHRKLANNTAFYILQASRMRISKTEYISCPSCGRTLFDLQETTAMIRRATDHLKGVKIAIMGCIVNGPGEMADADYGYVGTGPGKITLYRGKEVVKRNIESSRALEELIGLIREDGLWTEKQRLFPQEI